MTSVSEPTTFQVSDKKPEKLFDGRNDQFPESTKDLAQRLGPYWRNKCTEVLQTSNFPSRAFDSDNGFVKTVLRCYNMHHNIIIRPDDIWGAIMTQFSFYVNKNAEEFRTKFVNFEGKKELEIAMEGSLRTAPYDLFVKLMSKKIDENLVDPEVKKWVLPNFSTTTDNDLVSIGVVFMATMKKYFDYKCCLMCGIPSVTLEGSVDDWTNIHGRLRKLKEYKLEKWHSLLEPVLQQFVDAKQGKVDLDFWQKICHHESGGSGPSYISGWITSFCVFDKDGNWQESRGGGAPRIFDDNFEEVETDSTKWPWPRLETDVIPTGIVEVDVKIDDNGTEYNSIMFSGHVAAEVMEDGCTLKPTLGWAIALKPANESESADADEDEIQEIA